MKPGVQSIDIVTGTGDEAVRNKTVAVNLRMYLLDGTDLTASLQIPEREVINLKRRDCIAGIRYGIEGMRVGGQRELIISPHLNDKPTDPAKAATLIEEAATWPIRVPAACLPSEAIYVDHEGHDGGVHRDRQNDELCLAFTIYERGQITVSYYMQVDSQAWRSSSLHELVHAVVDPVVDGKEGRMLG
jgi:hypothetical protein